MPLVTIVTNGHTLYHAVATRQARASPQQSPAGSDEGASQEQPSSKLVWSKLLFPSAKAAAAGSAGTQLKKLGRT